MKCGDCPTGYDNDGAKGCKVMAKLPSGFNYVILPSKVDTCTGAGLMEVALDECIKAVPLLEKGADIHDPKGRHYGSDWPKGCFQVLGDKGGYFFNLGGRTGTPGG